MHKSKTLNPVLLGRPLPAFDALAAEVARHVVQQLQQTGHRSLTLEIADAYFAPAPAGSLGAASAAMPTQVHLARQTLLQLMAQRYGFDCYADLEAPPTRTEERIGESLQAAAMVALTTALQAAPATAPRPSTQRWQWLARITVGAQAAQDLRLDLSLEHSAQLEFLTHQQRPRTNHAPAKGEPLQVALSALLLEKTVTAADIQQLHVGSLLPITLERARVTLNGQTMLTASVAEHQGKLHLTAFETLE